DFWDGGPADFSAPIEVHLELSDFATDMALNAVLTDFRASHDPMIAQLSYVFRKKVEVTGAPQSSADCEFLVFGGGDETRSLPS
ncbi:ATP-dependent endonuclease, partial [Escherichia coli]|nr:ATP-dependent endonuclease [Escherichia coli]